MGVARLSASADSVLVRWERPLCTVSAGGGLAVVYFFAADRPRSSEKASSKRWRADLVRTGRVLCGGFFFASASALNLLTSRAVFRSTGAPVGILTLTSLAPPWVAVFCSPLRLCIAPKSRRGSVSSMPWSGGLKFCRMRRHAERSSRSVAASSDWRLMWAARCGNSSFDWCLLCDCDCDSFCDCDCACEGVGSGVLSLAASVLPGIFCVRVSKSTSS